MDAATLKLAKNYTNEQVVQKATNSPVEEISFDGGIYSVGNNVVNGQVSVTLKGRSLKNELNYNRDTWAEWEGDYLTRGITGLKFTVPSPATSVNASINTVLKPLTKYGVLYYVVTSDLSSTFRLESLGALDTRVSLSRTVGNRSKTFITASTIISNYLLLQASGASGAGKSITIRDVRVFELPAGSEIESDFTNLTADQLAQKYPYIKGDSVKSTNSVRIRSVNEDETKESIAYVNLPQGEELRSLPNGTKDEVSVSDGKRFQRTNEHLVLGVGGTWSSFAYTSTDNRYVYTYAYSNFNPPIIINYDTSIVYLANENISIIGRSATGSLIFGISQSVLDDYTGKSEGTSSYSDFKNYIDSQSPSLIYQLATPIVTKLPVQAPLQVFENGTVYVEPIGDASESTLPSVEMTIPTGTSNKFGVATHDYGGAAADWVLTKNEANCGILIVTNAGGAANIIAPNDLGRFFFVKNDSGYDVVVKSAGAEAGTTIADGNSVIVFNTVD